MYLPWSGLCRIFREYTTQRDNLPNTKETVKCIFSSELGIGRFGILMIFVSKIEGEERLEGVIGSFLLGELFELVVKTIEE